MKAKSKLQKYRYRSAVTGRIISATKAAKCPKTTIRERVKPRPKVHKFVGI